MVVHNAGTTATVPLAFDPSAPLHSNLTATASSTTGLVDNQIVQLTGSGFDPHTVATAIVCRTAPPSELLKCRSSWTLGLVHVDASGSLTGTVALRAVYADGTDCRTQACELRISSGNEPLRPVRIPLTFLPDAPLNPPRVAATPNTGLTEGQTVRFSGEHYPPLSVVEAYQCIAGGNTVSIRCDLRHFPHPPSVTSSATGTFEMDYTVHPILEGVGNVPPWNDCGPGGHPCELVGAWISNNPPQTMIEGELFSWAFGVTPLSFSTTPATPSSPQGAGGTSPPAASVSATPTFTG